MSHITPASPGDQLNLVLRQPRTLNVDGMISEQAGGTIRYIGTASQQLDGTWRCLANANGLLCLVEVSVKEAA